MIHMKNRNTKKPATNKVSAAFSEDGAQSSTVTPNKKHHKKPKKQYL